MADLGEAVSSQQGKEVGRRKDAFQNTPAEKAISTLRASSVGVDTLD